MNTVHVYIMIILGIILGTILGLVINERAEADTIRLHPVSHCAHVVGWNTVHSAEAQRCRDKGWVIHEHLLINRNGNAWTDLPPCTTEDSRRCYWNARTMGNGHGQSFVQLGKKGTFYSLKSINRVRA